MFTKEFLSNLSLKFKKGKVYRIVGKNGAGKTTLMHLLSGFFRDYSGKILFNHQNTREWVTEVFARRISFLTQLPYVMDWGMTVRQNILLGVEQDVSDDMIYHYLDFFHLGKKIRKHTKKLDAEIGEDIEFSGGEKQLIAFIRLLLQDRDIIIMDEGTNQLDAENEILVMNELLKQKSDKIIIFITHRMSTIARADEIYCLENQSISHHGTHQQLLEQGDNAYARFYRSQILHR